MNQMAFAIMANDNTGFVAGIYFLARNPLISSLYILQSEQRLKRLLWVMSEPRCAKLNSNRVPIFA